jgi:NAD(P)H dehydrogenase (quinone)
LAEAELPRPGGFEPAADIKAERALIGDADVFVFVYPFWLNSPPAMMKGYFERVFGMGFAYGPGADGNQPLLQGRKMVSIGSSGAPKDWVVKTGDWFAVHKLFDEHFAAVCCLSVVDHLHFGEIEPGIRADVVEACATKVATMFETRFARAKSSAPAC